MLCIVALYYQAPFDGLLYGIRCFINGSFFSFFLLTFMFFLPGSLLTGGHLPSAVCHLFMEKPCQLVWVDFSSAFPHFGECLLSFLYE